MCPCAMGLTYSPMRRVVTASLAVLLLAGCGGGDSSSPPGFDGERAFADLAAQVRFGPRPAGSPAAHRTAEWIAGKLREAGLEGVTIQSPWENVLGTIPGSEPGHGRGRAPTTTRSDIPGFVGANDGASGVAVLLELARTLPRPLPGPSVQLVAFDAEEARGRPGLRQGRHARQPPVRRRRPRGAAGRGPRRSIRSERWCSSTWSATATCGSRSSRTPTRRSTACSRTRPPSGRAIRRPSSAGRSRSATTTRPSWRPGSRRST